MEESVGLNEYNISATEVLDILEYLPENIISKIPAKFIKYLRDNSIPNYEVEFDYSKGLDKIPLSNKTRVLLAVIYRNYICTEEEQVEYDNILYENEEAYQKEMSEKYSLDNIFESAIEKKKSETECNQLIEYKEPKWYKKIVEKILKLFNFSR